MEKTWEEFWATGKITDYLVYCKDKQEENIVKKEYKTNDAVSCVDRHCVKSDACGRLR
ncbi:MAG: hypothetical protein UH963_11775 [Agathobacter sp.]|nr:hypothetical protein [Agathobacter sp.]